MDHFSTKQVFDEANFRRKIPVPLKFNLNHHKLQITLKLTTINQIPNPNLNNAISRLVRNLSLIVLSVQNKFTSMNKIFKFNLERRLDVWMS